METFNNMENKTPSDTYRRVQLVCMKVQAHSYLELPQEFNQNHTTLINEGLLWPFRPSYSGIMQFQISSRRESM